jgi:phosphotransferase system enzyme I (PtsP)
MLGVMIEVPALLWQLDRLFPLVNFASVGSNDLLQFLYAADRTNLHVSQRFDPLSQPVLKMLGEVAEKARAHGVPLTLCGEMAGNPLEALALVALGYQSISMAPASIGPVKAMIRSLDAAAAGFRVQQILAGGECDIRRELREFAARENVEI